MLLATARVAIVAMTMAAMARADPFKTVHINDAGSYCLILPEHKMDIGASEYDGGAGSYCIDPKKNGQRQLPQGIWKNGGPFVVRGSDNGDYIQLTGTFDADMVPVLNPHDAGGGGQYDSNGGSDGRGNPRDSRCKGYASYVEIVEPNDTDSLACIRCCQDTRDCPIVYDTGGCRSLIPGQY